MSFTVKRKIQLRHTVETQMKSTRTSTIFCLLVGIQVTAGILVEQPENTAAMLNGNVTFKCKSDKGRGLLRWYLSVSVSEDNELWSGYFFNPNKCPCECCYIDDKDSGKYNLIITAKEETATHYMCFEPGSDYTPSASLIVIKSTLASSCNVTNTLSGSTLSCVIIFHGEWVPKIKWSRSDGKQVNEADVTVSKDTGKVTSTLSTPLTLCEVADATPHANNTTHAAMAPDEVKFTVKFTASAYFDATDRPAEVSATNVPIVPEDAAKWESPPFYNATSKDTASGSTQAPPNADPTSPWKIPVTVVVIAAVCAGVVGVGVIVYRQHSRKKERQNMTKEGTKLYQSNENQPA